MARINLKSAGLIGALLLLMAPNSSTAGPPPGTVERRWIVAEDQGHVYGLGHAWFYIDIQNGNPTGAYYRTLVREGWIYRVRAYNWRTRRWYYYWQYSWDSQGQIAPYDIVNQYYGYGDPITDDFGQ